VSKLKKLAGETVLYGMGSIVPRALNFLLVPLHTINMFSKAEYGVITKLFAVVAVANVVYMMGMETAFFRFATKPGADRKKVFNLTQTVVVSVSSLLTLLLIVFATPLSAYAGSGAHPEYIVWIALLMFIDAVVAIPFARLRLEKKAMLFASIKIANVVLLLGLNYYFLKVSYNPAIGVGYVFLANLAANALFVFVFFETLLTWRPTWDKSLSPQLFSYAYPVMITGVAGMMNEMFSRYMLDWWLPEGFYPNTTREEAGGIFGACYKFAIFMNLGIQAFRYAAEPFFFSSAADKNSRALFAKVNHFFILACCVVLVAIGINMDVFKYFVGEPYWVGIEVVPVLLLAYLFLGVYYNMSAWFKLTDRTHYGTLITFVGVAITVAGNYFLIPLAGYMGSSIAAFLCYFTMAVLCYAFGQKYYPIPYRTGSALVYITLSFVLVYSINAVHVSHPATAIAFHACVLIAFVFAVYKIEKRYLLQPV
jgi:O-antigen/teichoic acid export membrane protein